MLTSYVHPFLHQRRQPFEYLPAEQHFIYIAHV